MGFAKNLGRWIREGWLIVGITLMLFLIIESGSIIAIGFRTRIRKTNPQYIDDRLRADAYAGSDWVHDYFAEYHSSSDVFWSPYVYWRRRAFRGRHISIGLDGTRITPGGDTTSNSGLRRIYIFGGSTVWGTGARDHGTIPAVVARELEARGYRVAVHNYGESGYVSTQSVIQLLLLLRSGQVPHLVVFYDGINDTFSAYQQRRAGIPQNEFNRSREFNISQEAHAGILARLLVGQLATVRILRRMSDGMGWGARAGRRRREFDYDSLARATINAYQGNVRVVQGLAKAFGFQAVFYWQPTVFDKPNRTPYEDAERLKLRNAERFFEATHRALGTSLNGAESFNDLSAIFSEVREPVFIDWSHLSERGNAIVGSRIAADLSVSLGPQH